MIRLWLDDVRDPAAHGRVGWLWVQTAEQAIRLLKTGRVIEADLDHDLSIEATLGCPKPDEQTGYTVVCWMEENDSWPENGVHVHSMNPAGRARMMQVIDRHYRQDRAARSPEAGR